MGEYGGYDLPRDIVMISTADWDEELWTNKQQIAWRLAGDFRILYVEPLAGLASGKRGYSHRYWRDPSGVHVFRPPGTMPFGQKVSSVNELNHRLVSPLIRDQIKKLGLKDYILWLYPPSSAPYLKTLNPELSCYDCVDEYACMPGHWMQATRQMERKLIMGVDVVFTTAQFLYETRKKHNPNTHLIPNVADFEHFNKANTVQPSKELEGFGKPVIGYIGALNYKLDDTLMHNLFSMKPEWTFLLIGPDRGFGIERFLRYPNVRYLGKKSTEELPSLMAGMDACMIPYKLDSYTRGVLPLKFFEYLASGRPVIATPLPDIAVYDGLVDLGNSAEDFVAAISRRLENDSIDDKKKRIEEAGKHSWQIRIHSILKKLETTWRRTEDTKG
jgi:glycosyltransferase involved in cell wall biosynthesis